MRHRNAFTLVELLTVIAIMALLLQLLLPAVNAAREAARRSACQNNLRQVGLAMMNHEATHSIPPTGGWGSGWIGDPTRGAGKEQPGSWAYQLLPFLEQDAVFHMGMFEDGDEKLDALATLASTPVEGFYCPSRREAVPTKNIGAPVSSGDSFWFNAAKPELVAHSDYVANVGDRWVYWHEGPPPDKALKGEGFFQFSDTLQKEQLGIKDVTGVVVQRQPIPLQRITDGLSKTYFAGEKFLLVEVLGGAFAHNDDQSCWNGDDLDAVASTEFRPGRDSTLGSDAEGRINGIEAMFGSAHPAAFNMLLCDGSIKPTDYGVDRSVFRHLGNRRDGANAVVGTEERDQRANSN